MNISASFTQNLHATTPQQIVGIFNDIARKEKIS
jgi:hypothetical protein